MKSNIFFFRSSEVGLSVTTTKEGLFDEALISPHEPSSKENLTPLTVRTSVIICESISILLFLISSTFLTKSSTI
jgi:hypothetical protein